MIDRDSADRSIDRSTDRPSIGDPGLAAIAAATDAQARAAAAPPPAPGAAPVAAVPAAPIDWKAEARDLWKIIAMLSMRFPSLDRVYTPPTIEHLATAWAPVLERHNLDMGRFTIYLVAGAATLPVLGETYKAIQHDRAIEQAAAAAAPGPVVPPAAAAAASSAGAPDQAQLHRLA